jgi:hypothetical protein
MNSQVLWNAPRVTESPQFLPEMVRDGVSIGVSYFAFTGGWPETGHPLRWPEDSSAGVAEFSTWRRRITFACQSENASTSSISLSTIRRRQLLESSLQAAAEPVKIRRHLPAGMREPTSPQLVCFHPQRDGSGQCGTDRLQPSRRNLRGEMHRQTAAEALQRQHQAGRDL